MRPITMAIKKATNNDMQKHLIAREASRDPISSERRSTSGSALGTSGSEASTSGFTRVKIAFGLPKRDAILKSAGDM